MPHDPESALQENNWRYFTFLNLSIALILMTSAVIAIFKMLSSRGFNTPLLLLLSAVKFFGIIANCLHLRGGNSQSSTFSSMVQGDCGLHLHGSKHSLRGRSYNHCCSAC